MGRSKKGRGGGQRCTLPTEAKRRAEPCQADDNTQPRPPRCGGVRVDCPCTQTKRPPVNGARLRSTANDVPSRVRTVLRGRPVSQDSPVVKPSETTANIGTM